MANKLAPISIRFSIKENAEIRRRAELLNLSKSDFIRQQVFNKTAQTKEEEIENIDYSKIENIISNSSEELASVLAKFMGENFQLLGELIQQNSSTSNNYIPFFAEYRHHHKVESNYNGLDLQETKKLAKQYEKEFGIKPNPNEGNKFGNWPQDWGLTTNWL